MRMLQLIGALALLLTLSGCIWNRTKVNDAAVRERAQGVTIGVTHASELPRLMGTTPSSVIPLRDGRMVHVFSYGDAKTEGLSLLIITLTKTNSYFTAVYVLTDTKGIVRGVHTSPEQELDWEMWPFGE